MKKLLFTGLLGMGLLLPATFSAATTTFSTKELSAKKPKKSNSRKSRSKGRSYSNSYSSSRGCTYNGHTLYVGERGGCYYYTGSSKKYVDRSYCSSCN